MNSEDPSQPPQDLPQAVDALFKLDADWEYEEYDEPLPWWARSLTDHDREVMRGNRQQWDEEGE
jgi:hypothetical protein